MIPVNNLVGQGGQNQKKMKGTKTCLRYDISKHRVDYKDKRQDRKRKEIQIHYQHN